MQRLRPGCFSRDRAAARPPPAESRGLKNAELIEVITTPIKLLNSIIPPFSYVYIIIVVNSDTYGLIEEAILDVIEAAA